MQQTTGPYAVYFRRYSNLTFWWRHISGTGNKQFSPFDSLSNETNSSSIPQILLEIFTSEILLTSYFRNRKWQILRLLILYHMQKSAGYYVKYFRRYSQLKFCWRHTSGNRKSHCGTGSAKSLPFWFSIIYKKFQVKRSTRFGDIRKWNFSWRNTRKPEVLS